MIDRSSEPRSLRLHHYSLEAVSTALQRAYEGYAVPVAFTAEALALRIRSEHVDLSASSMLLAPNGDPQGVMLIARRGRRARLAALGIGPEARGRGLARAAVASALQDARRRGDREMVLEVISTNITARRLYERCGFVAVRTLVGYERLPGDETPAAAIDECDPDLVLPLLLEAYPDDPSWQTAPICFAAQTPPSRAFVFAGGQAAALLQPAGGTIRLQAFAVAPASRRRGVGRRFMASLLGRLPATTWSIPAIVPEHMAAGFLAATGWRPTALVQVEMSCRP
ncbi:MAG: GNAT family N-acetyltransferase [Pseudomonadota bacterium]